MPGCVGLKRLLSVVAQRAHYRLLMARGLIILDVTFLPFFVSTHCIVATLGLVRSLCVMCLHCQCVSVSRSAGGGAWENRRVGARTSKCSRRRVCEWEEPCVSVYLGCVGYGDTVTRLVTINA